MIFPSKTTNYLIFEIDRLTWIRYFILFIYLFTRVILDCNERTRFVPQLLALFFISSSSISPSPSFLLLLLPPPETRTGFLRFWFWKLIKKCLWGRDHVLRWNARRAWRRSPSIWAAPPPTNYRRRRLVTQQTPKKWCPQEITDATQLIYYKTTLISSELVLFALALSSLAAIFTCTGKSI